MSTLLHLLLSCRDARKSGLRVRKIAQQLTESLFNNVTVRKKNKETQGLVGDSGKKEKGKLIGGFQAVGKDGG